MRALLTIAFSFSIFISFCQKPPLKFGDITQEEVSMTSYPADSSATAVVLFDYGTSSIAYVQSNNWFQLTFERISRIKILTKDGYRHADFEVPLYHSSSAKEKLTGLKVVTYNSENGKIVQTKMKSDGMFEEKYDQNIDLIKFTAPNVKEGSVIEVTYRITSDFLHYFRDWEFQSTIPVMWSEYRAAIPEYFNYEKFMQGYIAPAINESKEFPKSILLTSKERSAGRVTQTSFQTDKIDYKEVNHRWAAKDVPAFRSEPFMTTHQDYISKINFELAYYKFPNQPIKPVMGTWADLNKSFLESENFGAAVKGSGFLRKITEEATAGASTPKEKVAKVYNFVLTNVEWDGSNRKFLNDDNLKAALDKKKGSSSHINLILVSMLQKAGITAHPVLISTRSNGFVRENFALSSQFNYVIALVVIDGESMLLDATDRLLPMGVLPERCLNGRGYVISQDSPGWVDLTAPKSKVVSAVELSLNPDGELEGQLKVTSNVHSARRARYAYLSKGEEEYLKNFEPAKTLTITKAAFNNLKEIRESFEEVYDFTWDNNSGSAGTIFISPMLHLQESANPFKLEKRDYPVDFGSAFDKIYTLKLQLPENYQFDEVPEGKVISLPANAGRFIYNTSVTGNTLSITSMLNVNKSMFTQDEYPLLREFYNIIVAKQAEPIVVKKK
ncbi:MAG: DUF3857 domain-containing protein [Cyclobacteriaceae bacterium]|nr:DUF3857 domain-containing protein [Cyclobacteriaceae bacterium]